MPTNFDRDDRLHGLLRDTLRSQPASGTCVDAETLAAWAEQALTPEDTAAADAHLATCARCRELAATLSTMLEAEGATASAVVPFTPRPNGRWKAIAGVMGAVAASALIWVAVRDGSPSPDATVASRAAESPVPGIAGGAASPAAAARPADDLTALQSPANASRGTQGSQGQQGQQAPGAPRPEAKLARETNARLAEPSPNSAKPSAAPVEPPARPTAPPPAAGTAPPPPQPALLPPAPVGSSRASTVAGLPQSSINTSLDTIKPADANKATETFFSLPPVIAEFIAGSALLAQQGQAFGGAADRSRAAGAGRGGAGGGAAAPPPVQWRIHGPSPLPGFPSVSALSRSTDAGKTWQPVGIEATTPQLTAGSAPTNTVCWLAGRAGTVLLSENGETFRLMTKPTEADLVAIQALNARSATVRTADGRTFTTTDGGVTWTPRSNSPSQ